MTFVKICGVVSVADALMAVAAGADAIGLNLVASSKRRIEPALARSIRRAIGQAAEVVAVVADRNPEELASLRLETEIEWLQLHGKEPKEVLDAVLPRAYKAVGIASVQDVEAARGYGGERLLADAKVEGALGGTGQTFDWSLVQELARSRPLLLAGGLTPENVAEAVLRVRPWGVDVASGVESEPRKKDRARVERFIAQVRAASSQKP